MKVQCAVVSALVVFFACSPAQASSLSISEAANADVFSIAGDSESSSTPGPLTATSCCITYQNNYAYTTTAIDGTLAYGSLSGSASIDHGGQGNDWYSNGSLNSSWSDTVTLQPGTYDMTLIFDSTTSWTTDDACGTGAGDSASASVNFYLPGIYGGGYGIGGGNGTPCFTEYYTGHAAAGTSALDQVLTGSFTVNQVTTSAIVGALSLGVGTPTVSGTMDVSVNASLVQFYLDGVSAGAGYTTESGNSYETPSSAPEPGTLGLLAGSLIGLAAFRRR